MTAFVIATAFSPLVFDGFGQVPAETLPANSISRRGKGRPPKSDTAICAGSGWWTKSWTRVEDFWAFRGEVASRAVVLVKQPGAPARWSGHEGAIFVARVVQRRIWQERRTGTLLSERQAAALVAPQMGLPASQGPARYFQAKRTDAAQQVLASLLPGCSATVP